MVEALPGYRELFEHLIEKIMALKKLQPIMAKDNGKEDEVTPPKPPKK